MYCSSCGTAVTPGLSYCNRCGAGLNAREAKPTKTSELPESLVWGLVSVSVGGIGALIALLAVMKESLDLSNQWITLFTLLSFLLLLGAESVFIWMLVRRSSSMRRANEPGYPTQLPGPVTRELGEGRIEPAMSVTEHTTHTLEPAYRNRKTDQTGAPSVTAK